MEIKCSKCGRGLKHRKITVLSKLDDDTWMCDRCREGGKKKMTKKEKWFAKEIAKAFMGGLFMFAFFTALLFILPL